MSLKQFHIFFITLSILLCFSFGVWGLRSYAEYGGGGTDLVLGLLAFIAGAVLIVYGVKVFQKLKTL
ncbi:MAG: hypothetical protein IID14_02415 [Candidatus Marinimicrobia bacterium]|nr:hypothetical protein [Candidatus Neomarinimicrobiota bacterium]